MKIKELSNTVGAENEIQTQEYRDKVDKWVLNSIIYRSWKRIFSNEVSHEKSVGLYIQLYESVKSFTDSQFFPL